MVVMLTCRAGDTGVSTAWMLTCAIAVTRVSMKASFSTSMLRSKRSLLIPLYLNTLRFRATEKLCCQPAFSYRLRAASLLLENQRGRTQTNRGARGSHKPGLTHSVALAQPPGSRSSLAELRAEETVHCSQSRLFVRKNV